MLRKEAWYRGDPSSRKHADGRFSTTGGASTDTEEMSGCKILKGLLTSFFVGI